MPTTIKMLKANEGDAFIIEVSENGESFNIVVDGGPRSSMRKVVAEIESLEKIDMMVLTHYDSDHIKGILEYLTTHKEEAKRIGKYWVNCPHVRVRLDNKVSSDEASTLKTFFEQLETECQAIDWRDEVLQGMKFSSPNKLVEIEVFTPTKESRKLNEEKYDNDMGNKKVTSERVEEDYKKSLQDLANEGTPSSKQVVNNASITFLLKTPHCSILMLGDVLSGDVYEYLTKNRDGEKYSKENKLKVDYVKVPHHGSRYNLTSELLDIIDCDNYLISTCGGPNTSEDKEPNYNHPDRMALAKILLHEGRDMNRKVNLYFNYNNADFERHQTYVFHEEELIDATLNFETNWDVTIL